MVEKDQYKLRNLEGTLPIAGETAQTAASQESMTTHTSGDLSG